MQIYIAHKLQRRASVNANNINGLARLTVIKKREKTCSNGTCCTARARVGYLNRLNMNTASPVNPVVSSRSERIKSESFKWAHVRLAYFTTKYSCTTTCTLHPFHSQVTQWKLASTWVDWKISLSAEKKPCILRQLACN